MTCSTDTRRKTECRASCSTSSIPPRRRCATTRSSIAALRRCARTRRSGRSRKPNSRGFLANASSLSAMRSARPSCAAGQTGGQRESVAEHRRRALRALLHRSVLSTRRSRRGRGTGAARRPRHLPRGPDLLRAAHVERGFSRRRAQARREIPARVRRLPVRRVAIRQLHVDGAQPLRAAARRSCHRADGQGVRALRVPPRRAQSAAAGAIRRARRVAPELPRIARAAPRHRHRAHPSAARQGPRSAGRDRGPRARTAAAAGRVLRIRRRLLDRRRGHLLPHGPRPDRGPRALRSGDHRRGRHVVPDALAGPVAARRQAAASHAPRRAARGGGGKGVSAHAERAALFVANEPRSAWHDQAVWWVRQKRDRAAHALPEWEELRDQASRVKAHTLSRLADYLEQFERNAIRLGAKVYWAKDADEHNRIVHGILRDRRVTRLVKSKSMLTEECHLNPYLIERGIEVVDTDLGERIVQLAHEPPSHIVMPAIHKRKEEIGELFHEKLGTPAGLADPQRPTEAARAHLREKFLRAQAGPTRVELPLPPTGRFV